MILRAAALGSLVIVGSSLFLPNAHAQQSTESALPGRLSITWEGPPECGNANSLEIATRKLLGQFAHSEDVDVAALATRVDETRYRVELHLSGAITGTRSLESAECPDAVQAAAVVLALAINPDALQAAIEESDPVQQTDPDTPPPPPVVEASPPRHDPSPVLGFVEIAARASSGITPFPSLGPELSGGVDYKSLRVRMGGFVAPTSGATLDPMGEARFLSAGGGADACYRAFTLRPLTLRGCLGMWLSWVRASSTGLEEPRTRSALIYSPRALLEANFRFHSRLSITLAGGAQVPTSKVRFQVDDDTGPTTVHATAPGAIMRAGLEFAFPEGR